MRLGFSNLFWLKPRPKHLYYFGAHFYKGVWRRNLVSFNHQTMLRLRLIRIYGHKTQQKVGINMFINCYACHTDKIGNFTANNQKTGQISFSQINLAEWDVAS